MSSIPRSPPTTASPSIPPFPPGGEAPFQDIHTLNATSDMKPFTSCNVPGKGGHRSAARARASRVALAGRVSHTVPGNGGTVPPFRLQLLFLKTSADHEISNQQTPGKTPENNREGLLPQAGDVRRTERHPCTGRSEHLLEIYYFLIINSLKKVKGKTLSDT